MGLTKRKDGYYVEFRVCERDGVLKLARGGRIKRWKVGQTTRHMARQGGHLTPSRIGTYVGTIHSQLNSQPRLSKGFKKHRCRPKTASSKFKINTTASKGFDKEEKEGISLFRAVLCQLSYLGTGDTITTLFLTCQDGVTV